MRRKNHSRVWEEIGSVIRQNKGRAILLVICMTASVILALTDGDRGKVYSQDPDRFDGKAEQTAA